MKTVSEMNAKLNLFWNLRLSDGIDGRTHFYSTFLVCLNHAVWLWHSFWISEEIPEEKVHSICLPNKLFGEKVHFFHVDNLIRYLLVGNVALLFWGLEQNDFIMAFWSSFSYVKRVFYLYFWGKFFEKLRYWPRSHLSFIGGLCWWWDIDWSIIMLEEKEWETCLQFIFLNASPSLFRPSLNYSKISWKWIAIKN